MFQNNRPTVLAFIAGSLLGGATAVCICFAARDKVDETMLVIAAGASAVIGTIMITLAMTKGDDDE